MPSILLLALLPLSLAASPSSLFLSSLNLDSATFNFSVPSTAANSDVANTYIKNNWEINGNKVDFGSSDIVFSPDPSTSSSLVRRKDSSSSSSSSSSTSTIKSSTKTSSSSASSTTTVSSPASTDLGGEPAVLRINYPSGSYSKGTGGTQFYAQPLNDSTSASSVLGNSTTDGQYERMLLSYDIYFPSNYSFQMGGKLPGLRGGPQAQGCSGGSEANGKSCFSTRLMWRTAGAGEVYAYVPTTQKGFCSQSEITCNSDYGTSLSRGSFSFATGTWQTIWLLVILNDVGRANGVVELYYNGVQALSFSNLLIRTSSSISSIGGLYFSTFFGGDDSSWATPTSQYTYFRNIQLFAGVGASNTTGDAVTSGASSTASSTSSWAWGTALTTLFGLGIFLG
ncbi:hypothetical protein P7C73_g2761, partial [Tremellales sp. Uapishka_1]